MTKLVIAEKPMLARDIARAMVDSSVSDKSRLPISGNGLTVCACAGHMLELVEPADLNDKWGKPWNEDVLPIAPKPWPKRPAKGKEKAVAEIGQLLEECDSVIHAGDPDDEGQLIVDELLDYLGYEGRVERVYINDSIEKNIRRAFEDLKDNSECACAGKAAAARQYADMCFGVSESRLATMRCHAANLLTVGRVQTPTLGLVVARDAAIEGHVKVLHYGASCPVVVDGAEHVFKWVAPDDAKEDGKHVLDKAKAEAALRAFEGGEYSFETEVREKCVNPPLPYNLTVLQADMNKRYGLAPARTLEVTQALRDKYKAITYNRSDSQYLKEEHFEAATEVLAVACANLGVSWELDFSIKSKAFNEAKVSAHHGIIPQEMSFDFSKLTVDEKRVYSAVVERFAMQFTPVKRTAVCAASIPLVEHGVFRCVETQVTDPGWTTMFPNHVGNDDSSEDESCTTSWLGAGAFTGRALTGSVAEKETKPPKAYTEGTLIKDMASISKYVTDADVKRILKEKDDGKAGENGGIGTTATRAEIIEKLKKVGYLEVVKGKIHSTKLGRAFYALLPDEIKTADVTARWWLIQEDVAAGCADVYAVMDDVCAVFDAHRESAYKGADLRGANRTTIGKCPRCGEAVIDKRAKAKSVSCASNKWEKDDSGEWVMTAGCGFHMWKSAYGKKLTENQLAELLKKGRTSRVVKGLKGKSGKPFEAYVTFDASSCSYGVEFASDKPKTAKTTPKKRGRW